MGNNEQKDASVFCIEEVANWGIKNNTVSIPALQRGLVWKPSQVELLWDSIARGFPIGAFIITPANENLKQGTNDVKSVYFLLDGQQRFNAISIGFDDKIWNNSDAKTIAETSENTNKSVLWLDVLPQDKSTRKFWFKVTTSAHPWGYLNDDRCNVLRAHQRRDACAKYNISEKRPLAIETWPYMAKLPIPASLLLFCAKEASTSIDFYKKVSSWLLNLLDGKWYMEFGKLLEAQDQSIEKLFYSFKKILSYRIVASILTNEVISSENDSSDIDVNEITSIEHLFTRLNTQGTKISPDDLLYSAIKAYWSEIKEANEDIAKGLMPPARLVSLAIRLALTTDNSDKIQSPKTIKQIREIAYTTEIKNEAKNAEDKNLILKLYGQNDNINDHSPLRMIITRVRKWLEFSPITNPSGLPPVLRTSIAIGSPDVFLLIMWFAKKDIDSPISISKEQIIAIATILHWFTFSEKAKSNVVNQIYSKCKSEVSIRNISAALFDSVQKCYLHKIYNPQDIRKAISVEFNREWRWEQFINKPFWDFICKLRWNRELILYAQRRYLAEKFQDYDPSRPDLWEEHNRPWDMDHIVPQNWIVGKQGEWREFCYQWLNNNGNFAAISFEINRSKSDEASWSEYIRNASLLLFDDIKEATINSINSGITYKKEISETFAGIVLNRFFKIIESWYNGLEIGKLFLPYKDITCSRTAQRQQIFLSIKNRLNGIAKLYYVKNNKEIPFIDQAQWEFCESWIILGIPISDKYLISIASDCNKIEIGIRKHPDSGKTNSEDFEFLKRKLSNYRGTFEPKYLLRNDWWYYLYGFDFNDDNFASKNEDKYSSELQDFYDLLKE